MIGSSSLDISEEFGGAEILLDKSTSLVRLGYDFSKPPFLLFVKWG